MTPTKIEIYPFYFRNFKRRSINDANNTNFSGLTTLGFGISKQTKILGSLEWGSTVIHLSKQSVFCLIYFRSKVVITSCIQMVSYHHLPMFFPHSICFSIFLVEDIDVIKMKSRNSTRVAILIYKISLYYRNTKK